METIRTRSTIVVMAEPSTRSSQRWPFTKRLLIQNAHPTKLVLRTLGQIWGVYFLWQVEWQIALAIFLGTNIVGSVLVWNVDEEALASTTLGKLVMLHWHPVTMSLHFLAVIPLVIGIMSHSAPWILAGISLALCGHLWGWRKADQIV